MLKRFHIGQRQSTSLSMSSLAPNLILENRYRIVRELGHGGFGRTYLAEDITRFEELCVVKEFAPQVQGAQALQKAQELFHREAGVLYRLQHPQIPRFRELIRATVQGNAALFLVQDYIPGQTYSEILKGRLAQGERFKEIEIRQLLAEVLPILGDIHAQGLIHRDISPDNLIRRESDQLTFLIDFGAVKQVVTAAVRQLTPLKAGPTQIRKPGYSPPEQKHGHAYPSSDLYALAVTMLVLLTGENSQTFYDNYTGNWKWQQQVSVSPNLAAVLTKMLSHQPGDRYQSATEVFEALNLHHLVAARVNPQSTTAQPIPSVLVSPTAPPQYRVAANYSQVATVNLVGRPLPPPVAVVPANPHPPVRVQVNPLNWRMLGVLTWPLKRVWPLFGVLIKLGLFGLFLVSVGYFLPRFTQSVKSNVPSITLSEEQRRDRLINRYAELEIASNVWIRLVNEVFYDQHPEVQGRSLDLDSPADAPLRLQWCNIGEQILAQVEKAKLSSQARKQIGNYSAADYDRWEASLEQSEFGEFNQRVNERFYQLFPQQKGKTIEQTMFEQIWYAIAEDEYNTLQP